MTDNTQYISSVSNQTQKVAFITGITGQDGAYLARLLLEKGYRVHGLLRRASLEKTDRIDEILPYVTLHHGDMTDSTNLIRIVNAIQPDEIYNMAAQSHVYVSFESPEYTTNADGLGCLRLLEAILLLNLQAKTRFYQASTSELYGNTSARPQSETTPFEPQSPYAAAKLYAYWTTRIYREGYNIHASNGILFNHESPLRGEDFVTRKITKAVARIKKGKQDVLSLGNLDSLRDWGHAKDYVEGMWMMLQQDKADDYVLATGEAQSVRTFVERSFAHTGVKIQWRGKDVNEEGFDSATGKTLVKIDPKFYRPLDVQHLLGDPSKAKKKLGWKPKITLDEMIKEMVEHDMATA